jgi:hypothetical protein
MRNVDMRLTRTDDIRDGRRWIREEKRPASRALVSNIV